MISVIFIIGLLLFGIFNLVNSLQNKGTVYAKVYYQNELILMINLDNDQYIVNDTKFKDQINTGLASEGIFYVPGLITTDMQPLYSIDSYAKDNNIVGIKLQVQNKEIAVVFQESPKNICQLQGPSNSALNPIVCLPNQLVINIYTNIDSGSFMPDAVLG